MNFLKIFLLLFPLICLAQEARSPFDGATVVDSYGETNTHRIVVNNENNGNFKVYLVSKTDPHDMQAYPCTREKYMDGGSRVISFKMDGKESVIYLPARPGESTLENFGNRPFFKVGSANQAMEYSSIYPLQKETTDKMISLYKPDEIANYKSSGAFPELDRTKKVASSKCGNWLTRLFSK